MTKQDIRTWLCPDWKTRSVVTCFLLIMMFLLFQKLLADSIGRWRSEPQYSHGFVIPLIAIGLGWARRDRIVSGTARSSSTGLILILLSVIFHCSARYLYIEAIDAVSFLMGLAGVVLLVWGTRFFLGVWPAIAFLIFMLPLPFQIERMLSEPLQMVGAAEATWYIQTLGIPAVTEGNTIVMGETRLGVAEACSGLRMLMVFFAMSAAVVILSSRTTWEKLLILLSAVPIALICNVARIVATAVAYQTVGRAVADLIFHDLSGWLMMPMALLLMYMELRLFDWLFVEVDDRVPGAHRRNPATSRVSAPGIQVVCTAPDSIVAG